MTADQSIALAASVGACLSAIATFGAVRQAAKQRESAYRPDLFIESAYFYAKADPHRHGGIPTAWFARRPSDKERTVQDPLLLAIKNLGLGAARSVDVKWSFALEPLIASVNQAAQRTFVPLYYSIRGNMILFESEKLGTGGSVWNNQEKESFDFVLPASVDRNPVRLQLPYIWIELCSTLVYLLFKGKSNRDEEVKFPPLSAEITYTDIGGRTHRTSFILEAEPFIIEGEGEAFEGRIKSSKAA